jgi:hypothetical protein
LKNVSFPSSDICLICFHSDDENLRNNLHQLLISDIIDSWHIIGSKYNLQNIQPRV